MTEPSPLLRQTLRTTAMMLVPAVAFLAILSAVALFAVPSSSSSSKEQRVTVAGDNAPASHQTSPRLRATARSRGGSK